MDLKLGIYPKLDKSYVLSKITQEQIFTYYLNVNVQTDYLIKTPSIIRLGDDRPSFGFKYSENGKLRARDFAGYFWGDCFDLVGYILKVNTADKNYFNVILERIAVDFGIHRYEGQGIRVNEVLANNAPTIKPKSKIEFQARFWDKNIDGTFWKKGNIGVKLLQQGNVFAAEYIWVNHIPIYLFNPKDRAYVYVFSENDIKVYFPDREKNKFLGNSSCLQGLNLLQKATFGIITKSYKDVLSLRSFNILAIALGSETTPLKLPEWRYLQTFSDTWGSLLDFDFTGLKMANLLKHNFNIPALFLPQHKPLIKNGAFQGNLLGNNYEYFEGVKDFYDLVSHYGVQKVQEKIKKEIKHKLNKDIVYG